MRHKVSNEFKGSAIKFFQKLAYFFLILARIILFCYHHFISTFHLIGTNLLMYIVVHRNRGMKEIQLMIWTKVKNELF